MKRTPKNVRSPGGGQNITKQSFGKDHEPSLIMERHRKAGVDPALPLPELSQFRDVSNVPDFQTALNTVATVRRMFDELPARTRATFHNDPVNLLDIIELADNGEEKAIDLLVSTELMPPPPEPESDPAPTLSPEPAPEPDTSLSFD